MNIYEIECDICLETGEVDFYEFTLRANDRQEALESAKDVVIRGVLRGLNVGGKTSNYRIAANNTITFDKEVNSKLIHGEIELDVHLVRDDL